MKNVFYPAENRKFDDNDNEIANNIYRKVTILIKEQPRIYLWIL